jgi:hypothetical protein
MTTKEANPRCASAQALWHLRHDAVAMGSRHQAQLPQADLHPQAQIPQRARAGRLRQGAQGGQVNAFPTCDEARYGVRQ